MAGRWGGVLTLGADMAIVISGDASEDRLLELGGLGADDSLRAGFVAKALKAFSGLLSGNRQLDGVQGEDLGALALIIADEAERVAERQLLDEARRAERGARCQRRAERGTVCQRRSEAHV